MKDSCSNDSTPIMSANITNELGIASLRRGSFRCGIDLFFFEVLLKIRKREMKAEIEIEHFSSSRFCKLDIL